MAMMRFADTQGLSGIFRGMTNTALPSSGYLFDQSVDSSALDPNIDSAGRLIEDQQLGGIAAIFQ